MRSLLLASLALLATVSLAEKNTCAAGDANCELERKKLSLLKESGIEQVPTKDQPKQSKNEKKSPEFIPYPIPQAGIVAPIKERQKEAVSLSPQQQETQKPVSSQQPETQQQTQQVGIYR